MGAATVVIASLLALVVVRSVLCAFAIVTERRRLPAVAPGQGPAISVLIPLYGWDEKFFELLDGLAASATRYSSPVEVVVVVDPDHPRHAEIAAKPLVRAIAPTAVTDGRIDKLRRLRCAVRAAKHPYVLLMDSDVLVDDGFLARMAAAHVRDPSLRLAFALPAYRGARATGDDFLGAFTLHHNLLMYYLGWWLLRTATSIGPSVLLRNDDGAAVALLDAVQDEFVDDHALAFAVARRGEGVRALPFETRVHATDPSMGAAIRQIERWMACSKFALHLLTVRSAFWLVFSFNLSTAGTTLLGAAFVAWALGHPSTGGVLAAGGLLVMLVESVAFALLEAVLFRSTPRWRAALSTLLFMVLVPAMFARSQFPRSIRWRGRDIAFAAPGP